MKSTTQAERLVLRLLDAMNGGELEKIADLVTEDFVDHAAPPGVPQGRDGYVAILTFVTKALELRYELQDVVAAGDKVAVRAVAHGRHNVDTQGFPATGRPYAMATMHIYRAEGDRLAEHWGVRDELGAMWQVGAVKPPPLPDLSAALRNAA
jgi:predicted ester cyclase